MKDKSRFLWGLLLLIMACGQSGRTDGAGHGPNGQSSPAMESRQSGTVDTLAGPGCPDSVSRSAGERVGSVAVSGEAVYAEVGPQRDGLVARLDRSGRGVTIAQAAHFVPGPGNERSQKAARPYRIGVVGAIPNRLAADGNGGLIYAADDRLFQRGPKGDTPLAGEIPKPATRTDPPSGQKPLFEVSFQNVRSVASDREGNLYVADRPAKGESNRIFVLNRSGAAKTFFEGTGDELTVAAGAAALLAPGTAQVSGSAGIQGRNRPFSGTLVSLAVREDRLYAGVTHEAGGKQPLGKSGILLLNLGAKRITAHGTELSPGTLKMVGGGGKLRPSNGRIVPARQAALSNPAGISADQAGNLFVADSRNHRVLKIDPAGATTTIAGTGRSGFNGNDLPGPKARLNTPVDVDMTPAGLLYISDAGNDHVRLLDPSGDIHAASGRGLWLSWTCGTANIENALRLGGNSSKLDPAVIAADRRGNVFFASSAGTKVKRVDPAGNIHTVLAAEPAICRPGEVCREARPGRTRDLTFRTVSSLAASRNEVLYVLDRGKKQALAFNASQETIMANGVKIPPKRMAVVAGRGESDGKTRIDRRGKEVYFGDASSLAADFSGRLFVADRNLQMVVAIDSRGRLRPVTPVPRASEPQECCTKPIDLAVSTNGAVYVLNAQRVWASNTSQTAILANGRRIEPGGIGLVAGSGSYGVSGDGGPAVAASFKTASAIAADRHGNLFVADTGENTVRRVDRRGVISSVLGVGIGGFNGDGLKGPLTSLNTPRDLVADDHGNLLAAEGGNDRIRRLTLH